VPKDEMKEKARALKKAAGAAPLIVSAASGEGVPDVVRALATGVRRLRSQAKEDAAGKRASARGWRP
jgi:GTP-binding protein